MLTLTNFQVKVEGFCLYTEVFSPQNHHCFCLLCLAQWRHKQKLTINQILNSILKNHIFLCLFFFSLKIRKAIIKMIYCKFLVTFNPCYFIRLRVSNWIVIFTIFWPSAIIDSREIGTNEYLAPGICIDCGKSAGKWSSHGENTFLMFAEFPSQKS